MVGSILKALTALVGAFKAILGDIHDRRLVRLGRNENMEQEADARKKQAEAAVDASRDTSDPHDFGDRVRRRGW